MKISDLKVGHLYTCDVKTIYRDIEHSIVDVSSMYSVIERFIWRNHRENPDANREIYIYLGCTTDAYTLRDSWIYKHHWFLHGDRKVVINNYCMRLLREIEDEEKL